MPTQLIEAYIGIDAAFDPESAHAIWRILGVRIPRRMPLSPALWPALPRKFHEQISGRFCSLFMQFKRPIFQDSKRAKYYTRIGGPYFEVGITPHQQQALLRLQHRVKGKAVVRYASPAFWSLVEFNAFDQNRRVLANSAFIPPSRVRTHKKWIYAGPSGKVVLNPEPEDTDGEAWNAVIVEMTEFAIRQSLREHVRSLAAAIGEEGDQHLAREANSWLGRIDRYGHVSEPDKDLLVDLSVVALAAEAADATWVAMFLPENGGLRSSHDDGILMWRWPLLLL